MCNRISCIVFSHFFIGIIKKFVHYLSQEGPTFMARGDECVSKIPGNHRDCLLPPTLLKMPFKSLSDWWKRFFFETVRFAIISSNFCSFVFFQILVVKNFRIRWKDIFKQQCHLRRILRKLATFSEFGKIQGFFRQITIYFSKKNTNFERFENFSFSSHILRQICFNLMEKITFRKASQHRI